MHKIWSVYTHNAGMKKSALFFQFYWNTAAGKMACQYEHFSGATHPKYNQSAIRVWINQNMNANTCKDREVASEIY